MTRHDVVYPLRVGDHNEELRYSLRALDNLPHRRVVLCGYIPSWTQNTYNIEVAKHKNKYRDAEGNLLAALADDRVSDPFWLFNDDFFTMQPMPEGVPALHRGPLVEVIQYYLHHYTNGLYLKGMIQTAALIQEKGIRDALSYELHVPMLIHKEPMLAALEARPKGPTEIDCYHLRTVYGNIVNQGGVKVDDMKVYAHDEGDWWRNSPLVSTSDRVFKSHKVGAYIRSQYTEPSPYEK